VATLIFVVIVLVAAVIYGVVVMRRGRVTVVRGEPAVGDAQRDGGVLRQAQHDEGVLRQAQHDGGRDAGRDDGVLRQAQHDGGRDEGRDEGVLRQAQHDGAPVGMRWSKRFDPPSGSLDDAARLALIGDLGFVRGAWCIPLLAQAYEEEQSVEHRRAVLTALAAYRHPDARATMELALLADDEEQRAIAAAALEGLTETRRA
jgi:hypothetical protein